MSLITKLIERPSQLSNASLYVVANGVFYLGTGLLFLMWPGAVQTLFLDVAFLPHEAELMRLVGMMLAIIGWLSIFGGRTGGHQFIAAGVLDRLFLVPIVLLPLAMSGIMQHTLLTFAVVDPTLAIGAWILLNRTDSM